MPVIDKRGQALPADHPLKGVRVIFGQRPPVRGALNASPAEHEGQRQAVESPRTDPPKVG